MGSPQFIPLFCLIHPLVEVAIPCIYAALYADSRGITSGLLSVTAQSFQRLVYLICALFWKPAITQTRNTSQSYVSRSSHPDRDRTLHGKRIDAGISNSVKSTLV